MIVALVLVDVAGQRKLYRAPMLSCIEEGDLVKVDGVMGRVISATNYIETDSAEYKMMVKLSGATDPLPRVEASYLERELEYEEEV